MHLLDMANFKRDTPAAPIDFMNFTERPKETAPPVEDPETLSARIKREVFGV